MTYTSKVQAIQNLHYCVGHITPERLQHLVENGQWSWTHASKPVNFAMELPHGFNIEGGWSVGAVIEGYYPVDEGAVWSKEVHVPD